MGSYLRSKFGETVYKIPVSLSGFTCPNIDGKVTKGGCTFCENESFSPNLSTSKQRFTLSDTSLDNPLLEQQKNELLFQYNVTKEKLAYKYNAQKYIIYFQSFSNTYAPLETLKALYSEALKLPDVVGLSIGTRSDCMNDEILEFLVTLSKEKEIWIEYGIQSVFNETLEKINRGHDIGNLLYWVKKTKDAGLKVCGHLIFGLPDEDEEMMLETMKQTVEMGVDSLKIHPLYIVKNTQLANDFKAGRFNPIGEKEYCNVVAKALKMAPENLIIQRLTAGIYNDTLVAPLWCKDKNTQMKTLKRVCKKYGLAIS